jgi:hypothetical protein
MQAILLETKYFSEVPAFQMATFGGPMINCVTDVETKIFILKIIIGESV